MTQYLKDFFPGGVGQKEIMSYLSTYNMATQAVAVDGTNIYNVQTTGGGACCINGVLIPALTADAELAVSTSQIADLTLADDYEQWFAFFATADGTLEIMQAGAQAAIGGNAVLKIPAFDPETYVCLAVCLYANDAASAEVTFGTTGGGVAWGTDGTFYQMIGPVFPHPDNLNQALGV